MDVCRQMGQFTGITMGFSLREDRDNVSGRPTKIEDQIIIGTPGTVLDLQKRRVLDFSNIKIFVLDEADHMLDKQGMGDQSIRCKKLVPQNCQIVLFSATFNDEVRGFASKIVADPNIITLKREELTVDAIKQYYMDCNGYKAKFMILSQIYGLLTIAQSMVFCHTRNTADELQRYLQQDGHTASVIHGGMDPSERDRVIDDFRKGVSKVLISTNVLARGIDVLQVSLVINFDMPVTVDRNPDYETYLHRIGRTGRFGRSGVSINFVHDQRSLDVMRDIEKYFGKTIERVPTDNLQRFQEKLLNVQQTLNG
jgi:ATP-dependent RNA helicase DDX19/DBP5